MRRMAMGLAIIAVVISSGMRTSTRADDTSRARLDGLAFEGHLVITHTGADLPETITFDDGELRSKVFQGFGFSDGPYSSSVRDGLIQFQAFGETAALGYVTWIGTISGDELMATIISRDPGEPEVSYSVKAKRVRKSSQRIGPSIEANGARSAI